MRRIACLFALSLFVACDASRGFLSTNPREQYLQSLERTGLSATAMGRKWNAAGAQSLRQPLTITLPYKEAGFFSPETPRAATLRFTAPRGQNIRIAMAVKPDTGARLFAELWQEKEGGRHDFLKALEQTRDSFFYEIESEGAALILRLQPELLVAVSYTLTITGAPSLGFPVKGGKVNDIGSIWGDPRDAGARRHEGIDIFGKKQTPVVAAADGIVTRVQETGLGGKVVWMRPEGRNLSLYYAHLDSQLVASGQRVRAGEVLGLMGNTGSARNTPTHLHFGIYGFGGAVNPYYFVAGGSSQPPAIKGHTHWLDSMMRTEGRAQLFAAAGEKEGIVLAAGTAVKLLAATGNFYRVELADGRPGLLRADNVKPVTTPLRTMRVREERSLFHAPVANEAVVMELPAGATLQVLAVNDSWVYGTSQGVAGWLRER